MHLKILKIFPSKGKIFQICSYRNPCNLFYNLFFFPPSKSWKDETNGLWNWRVSHFLIHCSSESSELSYKTCGLRKIGKGLFKDFFLCSLLFQDALSMTAHMSLFLRGALMFRSRVKWIHFVLMRELPYVGPHSLCPLLLGLLNSATI